MQNVKVVKGNLPVVVDVEGLDGVSPEKMRLELTDFLTEITLKTGAKPIIYSGLKFYEDNLAGYFDNSVSVSYTHLDVYKRQCLHGCQ